ncbi:MAG: hypothetical protein P9L93_03890 [Candidatus Gorgyraea atricola]|nr:hypothetical protein [Candidatus Gorgyraea atricola]
MNTSFFKKILPIVLIFVFLFSGNVYPLASSKDSLALRIPQQLSTSEGEAWHEAMQSKIASNENQVKDHSTELFKFVTPIIIGLMFFILLLPQPKILEKEGPLDKAKVALDSLVFKLKKVDKVQKSTLKSQERTLESSQRFGIEIEKLNATLDSINSSIDSTLKSGISI